MSSKGQLIVNTNNPVPLTSNNQASAGFFSLLFGTYIFLFIIVWIFSGLAGFIASFICLGFSGSVSDKLIGIFVAFLFGPIYWLYFGLNKDYCGRSPSRVAEF